MSDGESILIIDDRDVNILTLESLLESPGRRFLKANNGKAGLVLALNNNIDLLILDVQMPGMDGYEVAQILKSNDLTKDIPIIFASAEKTEYESMMKGFDEGAIDYLPKPLDPGITKAKVAVLLEIQRQKKQLREKNSALEKYALLINNSADIIGIVEPSTLEFEQVNGAFESIVGHQQQPLPEFIHEDDIDVVREFATSRSDRFSFETRVYTNDRSVRWLDWHIVVKNKKWFVNARDVTHIKESEEKIKLLNDDLKASLNEMEMVNKELESFSYSVSHDLRAPLRILEGFSSALLEDYADKMDEDGSRLLSSIKQSTKKMNNLIDDLLKFSKLGRKSVEKTKLDMNALVHGIVEDTAKASPHKANIVIEPLLSAKGDPSLLTQVWSNLISNAVKYSSRTETPVVEIGSRKVKNEIVYHVKDNGAGFDMQYAEKLFAVFQRLHKATEFEGTGIGLAIVQKIVARHGGSVWAEAKLNEGACFYFSLPLE